MNWRESDGIGDMLLAQRKCVTLFTDHASGRDPLREVQKQIGNALFRRVLSERGLHPVRGLGLSDVRLRQRRQNLGIDSEPCLNFLASHSAYPVSYTHLRAHE